MTMDPLITSNIHRRLEEPYEAAALALRGLDPTRSLRAATSALGLACLISICEIDAHERSAEMVAFSARWRLADGSAALLTWTVTVAPFGDGDTLLSASVRASTDSAAAEQQLLAAWPLIGGMAESHTRRMLDWVADVAGELTENGLELAPAELNCAA
jgi:hypothetical protein